MWDGNLKRVLVDMPERFDLAPCVLGSKVKNRGKVYIFFPLISVFPLT